MKRTSTTHCATLRKILTCVLLTVAHMIPSNSTQAAGIAPTQIVTDPATSNGAIVAEVSDVKARDEGTVSGTVVLRNVTTMWFKVYVTAIGDVDLVWTPLRDAKGTFFMLPPEGTSEFAYPTGFSSRVTFRQSGAALSFFADRTVESGYLALLLQIWETIAASSGLPTLPRDGFDVALLLVDQSAFADAARSLYEYGYNPIGLASVISKLGDSELARKQLESALARVGRVVTDERIKEATSFARILTIAWRIGQDIGFPTTDSGIIKAVGPKLAAQIRIQGSPYSAPSRVTLDGSGSVSTTGIQSYIWRIDGEKVHEGRGFDHLFVKSGRYSVSLTVIDRDGNQSSANTIILVQPPLAATVGFGSLPKIFTINQGQQVNGANNPKWISVTGSGFMKNFAFALTDVSNNRTEIIISDPARMKFLTSSEISVLAELGAEPALWSLRIINSNGSTSEKAYFTVSASSAGAALSNVRFSPEPGAYDKEQRSQDYDHDRYSERSDSIHDERR